MALGVGCAVRRRARGSRSGERAGRGRQDRSGRHRSPTETDAVVVRVEADGDPRPGAFLDAVRAALGGGSGSAATGEPAADLLARLGTRQERR